MVARFVFTETGCYSVDDVAKAYGLEAAQVEKFLSDWVDQRRPDFFEREFTSLKVLHLHYAAWPVPLLKMVRRWGKHYRPLEGEAGREFFVTIAPPRGEVS